MLKDTDLFGFKPLYYFSHVIGLSILIMMLSWICYFKSGFGWSSDPDLEFNWHPFLMTTGFIYLFGNSILIYRGLRSMDKYKLKLIHTTLHGLAIICVVIGLVAVFDFHNINNYGNMKSLHSWIGIGTVSFFCLQWLLGFLIYLFPGGSSFLRSSVMPFHVFFGFALFGLATFSVMSGLLESNRRPALKGEPLLMNMIGLFVVVYSLLVFYMGTNFKFKRQEI